MRRFIRSEKQNLGAPFRFPGAATSRSARWYIVLLAAVLLISGIYWLFFSPVFTVNRIRVQGTTISADEWQRMILSQFTRARWGIVPQRNIFAFDTNAFEGDIISKYALNTIYIKKDRPHEIIVTLAEKPRNAVWVSRGTYFALDSQAKILGIIPQPADALLIYSQLDEPLKVNDSVLAPAMLAVIRTSIGDNRIKSLQPEFIVVEKANATEFMVKVGEGWKIKIDSNVGLMEQLNNLELILRNSIPPDKRKNLDYIDLRFGERVYFKYR